MPRLLIVTLIAVACFALGYLCNTNSQESPGAEAHPPIQPPPAALSDTDIIQSLESPHLDNLVEFYQTKLPAETDARYELLRGYASFGKQNAQERSEFNELIRLLSEQDPHALYEWAQANSDLQPRRREMIRLSALKQLALSDTQFALNAASKIKDYWARTDALDMVLKQVSAINPEKALEQALAADLSIFHSRLLYNVLRDLTFEDPQHALDLATNRLPEKYRTDGIACVIKAYAQLDFDSALQITNDLQDPQFKELGMAALYREALHLDLTVANDFLASTPPSPMKDNVLRLLVYDRPPEIALDTAITMIETHASPNRRAHMLESLYSKLAIEEPHLIQSILTDKIKPADLDSFFNQLGWQTRDADAFDSIYDNISQDDLRSDYLGHYLNAMGYSRNLEASELFLKLQDEVNSTQTAATIAKNMAEYDVHASLQFAAQIKDPNHQSKALESITDHWFNVDAESAWDWLNEQQSANPDDAKLNEALQFRAITGISESQPEQALEFALEMSEANQLRKKALKRVLPQLYIENAQAADDYLETIQDTAAKDAAYKQIADSIDYANPEQALTAGLKISNPEKRTSEIQRLLKYWSKRKSQKHIIDSIDSLDLSAADASIVSGMLN